MTAPVRSSEPAAVHVALGARGYDVIIGRGALAGLGERIAALRPGASAAIVTDSTVASHHLSAAEAALQRAGIRSTHLVVPAGESSKSWSVLEQVCEDLIAARIERGDVAVALGGGVIGDLAGFAAAIVRRGLEVVQVPTTLLAQVDSAFGGKTAINSRQGKNLIGVFHQPSLVVADTALLDTLPARVFRAGYAEVVKYGLINDAGFFAWLEANWREVFARTPAREHAVLVLLPRLALLSAGWLVDAVRGNVASRVRPLRVEHHVAVRLLPVVVEILAEYFLAPEIEAVDVPVREVERPLVRLEAGIVFAA